MADTNIPRSANLLVHRIVDSPDIFGKLNKKQEETLHKFAAEITKELPTPAYVQDTWIYRIVVSSLGIVAISSILGAITLTIFLANANATVQIPDILTALGAAAIGALAGLLAPSPVNR